MNISSIRNVDPWRTWFHARLDELTSGLTDLYISNSEAGRQATHRREHIPLPKIITIPNGIDVTAFRKTAEFSGPDKLREYKHALGMSDSDRVIGIVANLRPQKGHDKIIAALPAILAEFPHTKCLFIGRNDFPDNNIHQLVQKKQLEQTIIFTGIRKDIARLLSICELFMLPSLWEGFPTVVIEAMAMGLPIIATPVGDIPDIVVPQQTGILISPKNPNVLVETVLELLKNPEKAQKMGQAGYERVRQHFSIEAMVRQTEEVYDRLLEQKTS